MKFRLVETPDLSSRYHLTPIESTTSESKIVDGETLEKCLNEAALIYQIKVEDIEIVERAVNYDTPKPKWIMW